MQMYYRVDVEMNILDAGGDWDTFALKNAADACFAVDVIGTNLFEYVTGNESRMWIETLVQRALISNRDVEVNYRCDGLRERRHFRLTLRPETGKSVLLLHDLLKTEPMQQTVNIKTESKPKGTQSTGDQKIKRCVVCNCVRINDTWVDPFDLQIDLTLNVYHGVCENCLTQPLQFHRRTLGRKLNYNEK